LAQFLATHSVVVLWAGFLIAVPLGQLVGHGDFLQTLMGDDYLRDYKRVLEETFEVMGYILMLAGTVEAAVELRCPSANKAANQQKIAITEPRIHLGI